MIVRDFYMITNWVFEVKDFLVCPVFSECM